MILSIHEFNIWKEIYTKIPNSATEKIRNFFWQNSQVQWVLLWKLYNMASQDLEEEVAVYINVKQNGKRLVDGDQYTYSKVRERADKVYYACTQKKRIGCEKIHFLVSLWAYSKMHAKKGCESLSLSSILYIILSRVLSRVCTCLGFVPV